jgi:hypothetical protein
VCVRGVSVCVILCNSKKILVVKIEVNRSRSHAHGGYEPVSADTKNNVQLVD